MKTGLSIRSLNICITSSQTIQLGTPKATYKVYLKLIDRQSIGNQVSLLRDFLQNSISKAGNVSAVVLNCGQTNYVCPR